MSDLQQSWGGWNEHMCPHLPAQPHLRHWEEPAAPTAHPTVRSDQSSHSFVRKASTVYIYMSHCILLYMLTAYLFHSLLISYNILLVREAFTHLLRASMISLSPTKYPSTEPPLEAENESFWLLEIYIYIWLWDMIYIYTHHYSEVWK